MEQEYKERTHLSKLIKPFSISLRGCLSKHKILTNSLYFCILLKWGLLNNNNKELTSEYYYYI